MYLQSVFFCLIFLTNVFTEREGCIEGEMWYERCKQCKCLKNGNYMCQQHLSSCRFASCIQNVVIFKKNHRCHCKENGNAMCVPLSYQSDLHGKSCSIVSYLYDNCTYCICDPYLGITRCIPINNCNYSHGGMCNEEEKVMENCHSCTCTFTKFRVCTRVANCLLRKKKPGKCYYIENFYPKNTKNICISMRHQECYSDYGCLGTKKCCQVVDCFLRCVDPDFS